MLEQRVQSGHGTDLPAALRRAQETRTGTDGVGRQAVRTPRPPCGGEETDRAVSRGYRDRRTPTRILLQRASAEAGDGERCGGGGLLKIDSPDTHPAFTR